MLHTRKTILLKLLETVVYQCTIENQDWDERGTFTLLEEAIDELPFDAVKQIAVV